MHRKRSKAQLCTVVHEKIQSWGRLPDTNASPKGGAWRTLRLSLLKCSVRRSFDHFHRGQDFLEEGASLKIIGVIFASSHASASIIAAVGTRLMPGCGCCTGQAISAATSAALGCASSKSRAALLCRAARLWIQRITAGVAGLVIHRRCRSGRRNTEAAVTEGLASLLIGKRLAIPLPAAVHFPQQFSIAGSNYASGAFLFPACLAGRSGRRTQIAKRHPRQHRDRGRRASTSGQRRLTVFRLKHSYLQV